MSRVKIALTALVILAALAFTGCHGSRGLDEFVIPESFDESRQYELTFWAKNDTNKTQTAIYEKAITDFQLLYPNITVNMRLYTDYGRIYNDVITNIPTNTTPNVCITYPDHICTYLSGTNTVVPLDSLFADSKYGLGGSEVKFDSVKFDELTPKFIGECMIDGQYYAIPFMRSTEACYINKSYVEKLGYTLPDVLTWDFIWEVSDAAAEKDSDGIYLVNGQKVMIPFIYKSTDNMMISQLRQLGSGYSDGEGKILIFNDDTRSLLKAVAEHTEKGAFSTFKISSYPANFLNAGQCVFAIDSTAGSTWMGTHAPLSDISPDELVDFETVVMPIPQFDTDNLAMISQGPSVAVFNKSDTQTVLASWLFAQFLLTNDVQIAYAETEGYVPVTLKAQNDEKYLDYLSWTGEADALHYDIKLKASRLLIDNIDNTFVTPVFAGSVSLRDAAGQLVESVTKSVRRGETVDDAYMDKLFNDVTALYRLDSAEKVGEDEGEPAPLPTESKILLITLGVVWIAIIGYVVYDKLSKAKRNV